MSPLYPQRVDDAARIIGDVLHQRGNLVDHIARDLDAAGMLCTPDERRILDYPYEAFPPVVAEARAAVIGSAVAEARAEAHSLRVSMSALTARSGSPAHTAAKQARAAAQQATGIRRAAVAALLDLRDRQ